MNDEIEIILAARRRDELAGEIACWIVGGLIFLVLRFVFGWFT